MVFEELDQPLKKLEEYEKEAKNEEIVEWFRKVQAARSDAANLRAIILDLREVLEKHDIDPYREKSPYYNFLLAYAYDSSGDTDVAIVNVDLSVSGFRKLGEAKDRQQAVSNWFCGLLLCKQGKFDIAKEKIDIAIDIFSKLDKERYLLGEYSKEYKDVIEKIKVSYANIRAEVQSKQSLFNRLKGTQTSNPPLAQKASDHNSSRPQDTPIKDYTP